MSNLMRKSIPVLKILNKATPALRRQIIKEADKTLIHCICECAKNILNGNVPLNTPNKRRLTRYAYDLEKLVTKKTPLKSKKRIIQKGGLLGALLTPVLSILGGLLAR